jgi:hypothetical protein
MEGDVAIVHAPCLRPDHGRPCRRQRVASARSLSDQHRVLGFLGDESDPQDLVDVGKFEDGELGWMRVREEIYRWSRGGGD